MRGGKRRGLFGFALFFFLLFLAVAAVAASPQAVSSLSGTRLGPLGRLGVVSAATLGMAASGLGIGYAFWTGALLLGVLQGFGLEEIVNYLSEGTQRAGSLWASVVLLAGAVLAEALERLGVPARWRAWVAARLGTGILPDALSETVPALLPRRGGEWHFAGEGMHGRRPPGGAPWIEPAARLLWPWAPVFLAACILFRVPAGAGWMPFLSLFVVACVAGVWARPGSGPERPERARISPEAAVWAILPVGGLYWGLPGLAVAVSAAAVFNTARTAGTLRGKVRLAWEALSIDLVVLIAGVVAYGAMLEGARLGTVLFPWLESAGLLGGRGILAAFGAAAFFSACGGALTGIGLLAPLAQALSSEGLFTPAWLAAILGGALVGELGRAALWTPSQERPGGLRTAGGLGLIAAASLFPGLLRTA